jgi:hypothetical protein
VQLLSLSERQPLPEPSLPPEQPTEAIRRVSSAEVSGQVIGLAAEGGEAAAVITSTLGLAVVEETDFACVIVAAVGELTAKGVVFIRYDGTDQEENGVWTTPGGGKVAWFSDPDGKILSLTQFL